MLNWRCYRQGKSLTQCPAGCHEGGREGRKVQTVTTRRQLTKRITSEAASSMRGVRVLRGTTRAATESNGGNTLAWSVECPMRVMQQAYPAPTIAWPTPATRRSRSASLFGYYTMETIMAIHGLWSAMSGNQLGCYRDPLGCHNESVAPSGTASPTAGEHCWACTKTSGVNIRDRRLLHYVLATDHCSESLVGDVASSLQANEGPTPR